VIPYDPFRAKRGATNEPQTALYLCGLCFLEDERQRLRVENVFAALAAGRSRCNRPVVDEERRYVCGVRPDRPRADGSPVGGGA